MNKILERGPLHKRTLELLGQLNRSISQKDIAKATGLSEAWISRFARGELTQPSVNYVECLHNYLVNVSN